MALNDKKLSTYTDNVKSLSDYPSDDGMTAEQLKAIFDGRTDKEVKNAVNGIIDELTATTGAEQIKAASGNSVQTELDAKAPKAYPAITGYITIDGTDGDHRIGEGGNSSGRTEIQNDRYGTKRTLIIGENELRYRIGTDLTEHKIYAENNKPTKADVGLSNVDNTSDMDKPISTAVQAALDTKMEKAALELETPVQITGEDPTGIYEPVGKISVDEHEVVIAHETATLPLAPTLLIGDYGLRYQEDGVTYGVYTENNKPPVDAALSATSENPVQNKVINNALIHKVNSTDAEVYDSFRVNNMNALTQAIIDIDNSGKVEITADNSIDYTYQSIVLDSINGDMPKLKTGSVLTGDLEEGYLYTELNPQIQTGMYSGNGSPKQSINLGKRPKFVYVSPMNGVINKYNGTTLQIYGGLALDGQPLKDGSNLPAVEITNTGFSVDKDDNYTNEPNTIYYYIWG